MYQPYFQHIKTYFFGLVVYVFSDRTPVNNCFFLLPPLPFISPDVSPLDRNLHSHNRKISSMAFLCLPKICVTTFYVNNYFHLKICLYHIIRATKRVH